MRFYVTACSDARQKDSTDLDGLARALPGEVTFSEFLFDRGDGVSGSASQRGADLSRALADYDYVLDISGGNRSNDILAHLDVSEARATFVGYSDLTTVTSTLRTAGHAPIWFQPIHLAKHAALADAFSGYVTGTSADLVTISYRHVCGRTDAVDAILEGGNLRTLLKLAGTPYFPGVDGALLLIEARTSDPYTMIPQWAQLRDMGVFDRVAGVLLGTFTTFEEERSVDELISIVSSFTGDLPVYRTDDIGHATDAKAGALGARYHLEPAGGRVQPSSARAAS